MKYVWLYFMKYVSLNEIFRVTDLICLLSSSDLENFQVQSGQVQRKGFSPVWVLRWAFRWEDLE